MPSITLDANADAVMGKQHTGGTFSGWNGKDNHIQVGSTANYKFRGVIKFPVQQVPDFAEITEAVLQLTFFSTEATHSVQNSGQLTDMRVARVTADWGEGSIDPGEGNITTNLAWDWNNRHDKWTQTNSRLKQDINQTSTGDDINIDVTEIVRDWLVTGRPNYGFILVNVSSEDNDAKALLFYSRNTTAGDGVKPKLIVDYTTNTTPDQPTPISPTNGDSIDTLTPTFVVDFNDSDVNDYVTGASIVVYPYGSEQPVWYNNNYTVTGQPTTVSIPYGTGGVVLAALVPGQTYYWTIKLKDSGGLWSPLAPTGGIANQDDTAFVVNSPPDPPDISLSPGPLSAVPDDTPTLTITHSDPDPEDSLMDGYSVQLQTESSFGEADWTLLWDSGNVDISGSPAPSAQVVTATIPWGSSCRIRARTQDSHGSWSAYSSWLKFQVRISQAPINLNPSGDEEVGLDPVMTGTRATTADIITAYWLRVFSDDLNTTMLTETMYTTGITNGAKFSKPYPGAPLTETEAYRWQARIVSTIGGTSDWSPLQRFVVLDANTPTITSPVGDNDYTLTPNVTVTRVDVFDAVKFEVYPESSTTSSLGTAHYQSGTITSSIGAGGLGTQYNAAYSGTALLWNTGYKIRAAVSDDGGSTWSSWSGLTYFTTDSADTPVLTSVDGITTDPAWITDTTPDFIITRGGSDTIDSARVRVYNSTGSTLIWDSGMLDVANATTATITYAGPTLTRNQIYSWDAQYTNTDGKSGDFATKQQFKVNSLPAVPSSLFPPPAYVYATTEDKIFRASFSDADTALFSDLPTVWVITIELIDETPFDSVNITTNLINGLNVVEWPGDPLTEGEYRWRTRFRDSKSQFGTFSAWQSFKVSEPPNGTIVTPSDESNIGTVTPTVTWDYDSDVAQGSYVIDIAETDEDGVFVSDVTSIGPVFSDAEEHDIPAGYLVDTKYYNITLTVYSEDGLSDPTPSTVNVRVLLDAPNAITGVDSYADLENSNVVLTWTETNLKVGHTFISYRIYRRRFGLTDWFAIGDVKPKTNTTYVDWYAGNSVTYQYVVRAVTTKTAVGIELISPDDEDGGSFAFTGLITDNWTFVGKDRSPQHINNLVVTDENHNRPIQQEVFETLGSSRKVIIRGFVLGHEGSITTVWFNKDIQLPEDEQLLINETLQGRRIAEYLTHDAGPHILKTPFGEAWDVQFTTPNYTWLPAGHLEITLDFVETGATSSELF